VGGGGLAKHIEDQRSRDTVSLKTEQLMHSQAIDYLRQIYPEDFFNLPHQKGIIAELTIVANAI
jgi:hypothetical protein